MGEKEHVGLIGSFDQLSLSLWENIHEYFALVSVDDHALLTEL